MKKCFKCRKRLPLGEFYTHPRMKDGHLNKCKNCTRKDVHDRRYDLFSRDKVLEYDRLRFKTAKRKEQAALSQDRRRTKHPEKYKAWNMFHNALRDGKVTRQPCEVCGEPAQAHHEDYSKPLEVTWLCFRHHRFLKHGQLL